MAIPDNLESWRAYLKQPSVEPPTRPTGSRPATPTHEWAEYDDLRVRFLNSDLALETPDLASIQKAVRLLEIEATSPATLRTCALAVSGMPSMGKTTAALSVARDFERRRGGRQPGWDDNWQPAIYVVTPPATTPKMLMQSFCRFLGTPYRRQETALDLADRLVIELRGLHTGLVILDEIHNLQSNRQVGAEAASTLKLFAERLDAVFLYAGVDLSHSATFSGPIGQQLASRMIHHEMEGFGSRSEADRRAWASLLLSIESLLLLEHQARGDILQHASYLFDRSGGSIGRLRSLLRRAATLAILDGTERVDRQLLESVPGTDPTPIGAQATTRGRRRSAV